MSAELLHTYGAAPLVTRGKSVLIGGDPKGKNFLYSCGNLFIRDLKNPINCEIYKEHAQPVTVARYAPSGFYIASADTSGKVRIWDTTQKEHILKIEIPVIAGPINDLNWSEDSKRIVAIGEGREKFGAVFMWDTGSSVGEITGHNKAILSCDFKQTRPYRLATGGEDFLCNWFEGPPFKFKKSFKEHSRFVNCVRFSPDGEKLVSVGADKTGFIYDGKTGDLIKPLSSTNAHTLGIYGISWSPDSKQFLTASADKTCKIWDASTGECVKTFTFPDVLENQQLGCLWQGDELISVSLGGDITYLDISNPAKPKKVLHGHNKTISDFAFSNGTAFTVDAGGAIVAWDIATANTTKFTGQGHTNKINKICVQNDHLVTAAKDDTIRFTPIQGREYSSDTVSLDSEPVGLVVGKKDSKLAIAVNTDSIVVIKDKKVVFTLKVNFQPTSVALSIDEIQVAVGGKDNLIHLYSLSGSQLKETSTLAAHRGAIAALGYSPDNVYLASACVNRDIFLWDTKTKEKKTSGWQFHAAKITCLAWAPDSIHLVTGSLDSNLFVWDAQKPDKRIHIREAHHGGVTSVAFLDENTVASSGSDCSWKTWKINFA
jgi:WD40 repeat protein